MALKQSLTADEFASLPEQLQEHYDQDGDNYRLDTDIEVENVDGLKSALEKERKRAKDLAADIRKYKDIDPEKARAAMATLEEIENTRLQEAGEFETLKGKLAQEKEDGIAAVKTELGTKLTKAESKLKQVMIENVLRDEYAKQGGFPKSSDIFIESAQKFVDLEVVDDDFVPKVKDGMGNNIPELITSLKGTDSYGTFFSADVAAGSGAAANNADPGAVNIGNLTRSTMSDKEKAAYIRENGLADRKGANPAFNDLPWK